MAKQQIPKTIQELCTPSQIYFIISFVSLFIMAFQNYGNNNKYCVGNLNRDVYSTSIIFILKIIYILFWTWVLNLFCFMLASVLAGFPGSSMGPKHPQTTPKQP